MVYGSAVSDIINNGLISGAEGIEVGGANAMLGRLVNRGTIEGVSAVGIVGFGDILQLTNEVGGSITGPVGVWNGGSITRLENSGSIIGLGDAGIYTTEAITTLINNAGGVITGYPYGVFVDVGGAIGSFTNGQGGDGSSAAKTALTYSGALPGNYYIQVASATQYGQLVVSNASGVMNIGVVSASGGSAASGRYAHVLTGVTGANLANTSGMTGNRTWSLEYDGTNYDLLVGADATNTRIALAPQANVVARLLAMRSFISAVGLDYDCKAFASNNYCVSFQSAYSTLSSQSEGAGVLIAAMRPDPSFRIGASIDLRAKASNTALVKHSDSRPLLGLFAAYDPSGVGLGFQARIAANTNTARVQLSRDASLPDTEAGHGEANLRTNALSAVLGYGFSYGGFILTPRFGLRRLTSTRASYTEADDIGDPVHYSPVSQTSTTSLAGLNVAGQFGQKIAFELSAGIDYDLYRNAATMSGASTLTGMSSFTITSEVASKRLRPYAQGVVTLALDKTSAAIMQVNVQNPPFSPQIGVSMMAGYRQAF